MCKRYEYKTIATEEVELQRCYRFMIYNHGNKTSVKCWALTFCPLAPRGPDRPGLPAAPYEQTDKNK